ncbi:MAG TPA: STAS domain-containing protein [Bryobacteraceae bacterium]|nr:STAS domain-containing protein [Bryobacteraceae bacterium]
MCILTPQIGTPGAAVLALAGTVESDSLPEIARFIRDGRQARHQVVLDLSDVTLLDRAAAQFFARQRREGVALINCPSYIEPWISREASH